MEPGSNKMGPRADEELAREDPPTAAEIPEDEAVGAAPPGMSTSDVTGRSRLATYLRPTAFPADRDALLSVARDENAPDGMLNDLRRLPTGQTFQNVTEAWQALGHGREDDEHRF